MALALTRKIKSKEQRIMILGDADFMNNQELQRRHMNTANQDFVHGLFKWFSYGQFPIDTHRPIPQDNRLVVSPKELSLWNIIFEGALPGMILLTGMMVLISRRNK